ncbi:hypothetical protein ACVWZW_008639 [Bradyrhizobium sp. F1.13.4]
MTERIVDALELVDVDIEQRELTAAADLLQFTLDLLAEQRPVRQVGERIVMRHMRNLLVSAPPFGDILDHIDEVARLAGFVADSDPGRGDVAQPLGLALPGMLVLEQAPSRLQRLAIVVGDDFGGGIRVYVEGGLANDVFA